MHQDDKDAIANNCYPITAQVKSERRKLINMYDEVTLAYMMHQTT